MSFDPVSKTSKIHVLYIFSSLLVIKMPLVIPFTWLSWFKFIYLQFVIMSGRIQRNCLLCQRNKTQLLITFLYFFNSREHLNLPFSFAPCFTDPPITTYLPKHFHIISSGCTILELQNKPIKSLMLVNLFHRFTSLSYNI